MTHSKGLTALLCRKKDREAKTEDTETHLIIMFN